MIYEIKTVLLADEYYTVDGVVLSIDLLKQTKSYMVNLIKKGRQGD